MSSNIQHTLLNLEITPPPGAWPGIAQRLDVEYDAADTTISQTINDWEAVPPVRAWENIQAGLTEAIPQKKPGIVIPFRKVAVAAAVVLAVSLISWYFVKSTQGTAGVDSKVANIKPTIPASIVKEYNTRPSPAAAVMNIAEDRPMPKRSSRPQVTNPGFEPGQTDYADYVIASDIPTASLKDVRAISTTKSPSVAGPLIRDANGKIILDRNLITAADNNYITVTGPNGEQTRISAKFFQMLSSMNGDPDPDEYFDMFMYDNSLWKLRFRDWRNKLLKQASFIPTATNFLDILELKDIIQE